MCVDCQAARGHGASPYPVMTRAQMRAGLDLLPTWALEQKAAANRQVITTMRKRLAAGEEVARMYQEPGLSWLERQAEVDLDTLAGELLAVANQTVEPTTVSLWLRPSDSVAQDQTDAARRQAFHSGPQRSRNGYQQSSAAPSISGRRAQPPTPAGRPNGDTWSSA
jgi:hypothetical protein